MLQRRRTRQLFVGESANVNARGAPIGSLSCSPARAPSTPAWRAACTTPSRSSLSTSTLRGGFGEELVDLRAEIFDGTASNLERTDRTLPRCSPSSTRWRIDRELRCAPGALAGHSIGEYAAGTLAGVRLETAIKVVSMRARLMHAAAPGVMVAVALSPDDIAEHLTDGVATCPR